MIQREISIIDPLTLKIALWEILLGVLGCYFYNLDALENETETTVISIYFIS